MDKYSIFINWLKDNGAKFPGLYFKETENNMRSVFTKEYILKDKQIITIPKNLLITNEMGKNTDIGRRLLNKKVSFNSPSHVYMIVFMITEMKKGNSFFKPYFDILPEDLSNFPIFWSDNELKMLQGSMILSQIQDRKRYLKEDYKNLTEAIPEFRKLCSYRKFVQLRTLVGSRNFGITIGSERVGAMVPMSDMLNHKRPQMTSWTYNNYQNAFTITSKENISYNTELMDSYGIKSKSQFLLHYGFIPDNNIEPDGRDPNEVGLNDFPDDYGKNDIYLSKPISKCSDIRELLTYFYRKSNDTKFSVSSIINLLVRQLDSYPTTLKQDLKVLKNGNIERYSNKHNALLLVSNEKEILQHYIDLFFKIIDVMDMSKGQRAKYIEKLPYDNEIRYYFNNIHSVY